MASIYRLEPREVRPGEPGYPAALRGARVSQFPKGQPAYKPNFPARNKIIAGLAEATVVVEASGRSGALYTATAARKLGRRLFAMPGSPGCDALLATGAEPLRSP